MSHLLHNVAILSSRCIELDFKPNIVTPVAHVFHTEGANHYSTTRISRIRRIIPHKPKQVRISSPKPNRIRTLPPPNRGGILPVVGDVLQCRRIKKHPLE